MKVVAVIVYTLLSARIAIGVHGAAMDMMPGGPVVEGPSPDELGLHGPLTRADALDAGRALGIDEELLAATGHRDRTVSANGSTPAAATTGVGA
jgi:hypothetical protein